MEIYLKNNNIVSIAHFSLNWVTCYLKIYTAHFSILNLWTSKIISETVIFFWVKIVTTNWLNLENTDTSQQIAIIEDWYALMYALMYSQHIIQTLCWVYSPGVSYLLDLWSHECGILTPTCVLTRQKHRTSLHCLITSVHYLFILYNTHMHLPWFIHVPVIRRYITLSKHTESTYFGPSE